MSRAQEAAVFQLLALPHFAVSGSVTGTPAQTRGSDRAAVGTVRSVWVSRAAPHTACPPVQLTVFVLDPTQIRYKEEFEKNKGKGFSVVADTPELQRIKKTQDQISNVSAF